MLAWGAICTTTCADCTLMLARCALLARAAAGAATGCVPVPHTTAVFTDLTHSAARCILEKAVGASFAAGFTLALLEMATEATEAAADTTVWLILPSFAAETEPRLGATAAVMV